MFDLHTHSNLSDGTLPPDKLVETAKALGIRLLALTDHDTVAGIPAASTHAEKLGLPFLCGIELAAEHDERLHILGLGIDTDAHNLRDMVAIQAARRAERNEKTLKLLSDSGMDVTPFLKPTAGVVTRANIAAAMLEAGFCDSVADAFKRFIGRGCPFFVGYEYPSRRDVIETILSAGGLPVIAHPMKMKCDHRALIAELKQYGLWGVEAYYGGTDRASIEYFSSLAREYGLHITCGSDFHGANRPGIKLGCAFRECDELEETVGILLSKYVKSPRRRGLSLNEYQAIVEGIVSTIPEDFFKGLNGGIVITEREKLHSKSRPERPLFILGEYSHGSQTGKYITLYYGSFVRVHGRLRGKAAEDVIRRVIMHEFRHHLEINAGQHDLEYEDDASDAGYLESLNDASEPSSPPVFTTYGDEYKL